MTTAVPLQAATAAPQAGDKKSSLLQRKCACGSPKSPLAETCEDCQSRALQAKLVVGPSDDPLEREADRIADQVMAVPAHAAVREPMPCLQLQATWGREGIYPSRIPILQRVPREPPFNGKVINDSSNSVWAWSDDGDFYEIAARSRSDFENADVDFVQDQNGQWYKIGAMTTIVHEDGHVTQYVCRSYPPPRGECFLIHGVPSNGDAGVPVTTTLQRKSVDHADTGVVPPAVHESLRLSGQPLDTGTRKFMESRFGYDFSQVRVHTDTKAAESARAVNALAYTVGRDVVFGAGRYAPHTTAGRHLLSHELAHVVQQSGAEGIRVGGRDEKRGLSPIAPMQALPPRILHRQQHEGAGEPVPAAHEDPLDEVVAFSVFAERYGDVTAAYDRLNTSLFDLRYQLLAGGPAPVPLLERLERTFQRYSEAVAGLADAISFPILRDVAELAHAFLGAAYATIQHQRQVRLLVRTSEPPVLYRVALDAWFDLGLALGRYEERQRAVEEASVAAREQAREDQARLELERQRQEPAPTGEATTATRDVVLQRFEPVVRGAAEQVIPRGTYARLGGIPYPRYAAIRILGQEFALNYVYFGFALAYYDSTRQAVIVDRGDSSYVLEESTFLMLFAGYLPNQYQAAMGTAEVGERAEALHRELLFATIEITIGAIPIVGDLTDIAQFVYGISTGEDVWGHPLSALELVIMGIAAVIPFVSYGARASARLATRLGRSPRDVTAVIQGAEGLTAAERSRVEEWAATIRRGQQIPEMDLLELDRIIRNMDDNATAGGGRTACLASEEAPAVSRATELEVGETTDIAPSRRAAVGTEAVAHGGTVEEATSSGDIAWMIEEEIDPTLEAGGEPLVSLAAAPESRPWPRTFREALDEVGDVPSTERAALAEDYPAYVERRRARRRRPLPEDDYVRLRYGRATGRYRRPLTALEPRFAADVGRIAESVWAEAILETPHNTARFSTPFGRVEPDFIPVVRLVEGSAEARVVPVLRGSDFPAYALLVADSKYFGVFRDVDTIVITDQLRGEIWLSRRTQSGTFVILGRPGQRLSRGIIRFAREHGVNVVLLTHTLIQ